jgi:hypothetical protein
MLPAVAGRGQFIVRVLATLGVPYENGDLGWFHRASVPQYANVGKVGNLGVLG